MANIWKGKPKVMDREISSSCPPRRIDIPRVDMKEIFGPTPWRNEQFQEAPTPQTDGKPRAPSPPQQTVRKPLELAATPPTPPTVVTKKAERVNTPPVAKEHEESEKHFDEGDLEAINAALEAFAIEQSKEQMRAKELEVSHPPNPQNLEPEPETPQTGKESAENQKPKPVDKPAMEPKPDKSQACVDKANLPVVQVDARITQLEQDNAKLMHLVNLIQEKYVNVAKRFHYVEDKIKRRDIDRLNTEKNLLSSLEKLQSNLKEKDEKINQLEEALTNCEIARLTSEEKILEYLRFEGHIHRQRTTNMKKLFKDFEMSKEVALLSDEQELAAEIVTLQQAKDEQAECLDFVRNCTICCEPYDDKERHRVGLSTCGHTFCADCVDKTIINSPFAVTKTASCPTCQLQFSRHQVFKVFKNVKAVGKPTNRTLTPQR
ncbi:Oidioi.mRNA.OKI2018_I69.PAR.g11574.t1.cds [Oikopleura dioica]|uniref:Oidioi.mRNA.OKI2018_I69.PAR.g11574.t1.cds n=1 Tax=Oikopleura dioica TaxID=34765 RepID=A0ABN7RZE0_OIKDI|nr:Oidioi.mRNA.OKI2018_I69.PAR.g11574.t1.cds [Oikopleura dioica]